MREGTVSVLIRQQHDRSGFDAVWVVVIGVVFALPLAGALLAPGDLALKAHLALHGICAQRPSHSVSLGGNVLPLDARMTGIYLGAVAIIGWLAVAGRLRGVARQPNSVLLLLALGVAVMAGDGIVGLLKDLRLPYPYEPSNALRLVTGMAAGLALGTGQCHLFAVTAWARPNRKQAMIGGPGELLAPVGILAMFGMLVLSGYAVFFAPLAVGLVAAVLVVMAMLCVSLVLLVTGRAWSIQRPSELLGPLAGAILLAMAVIGAMSAARVAAEATGLLIKLT